MTEELLNLGVMVNVICPGGYTDTNMASVGAKELFIINNLPILQPTVLNEVITYLASPESAGLTGATIVGKNFDEWRIQHR